MQLNGQFIILKIQCFSMESNYWVDFFAFLILIDFKKDSYKLIRNLIGFKIADDSIHYYFSLGSCTVNQECISIKECPYTRKLFAQVKATNDSEEKANLIQAIRVRVCGNPTDRTVCCDLQQGKLQYEY